MVWFCLFFINPIFHLNYGYCNRQVRKTICTVVPSFPALIQNNAFSSKDARVLPPPSLSTATAVAPPSLEEKSLLYTAMRPDLFTEVHLCSCASGEPDRRGILISLEEASPRPPGRVRHPCQPRLSGVLRPNPVTDILPLFLDIRCIVFLHEY
jgi:hypothetical protein